MIASVVMGKVYDGQDVKHYPERAGYALAVSVCGGYGLSLPFFLIAGWNFRRFKINEAREKAAEEER